MTEQSRHARYSEKQAPRKKRTLPLYGEKDDDGKFYRCWNCGFICNAEKHSVNEGENGMGGVVPTAFTDTDGDTLYYPDIVAGCAFCGSTNYR